MPAGQHNLIGDQIIEAGSTYDKTVPVVDVSNVDLDFTTWGMATAAMHLRLGVDSGGAPLLILPNISEANANLGVTGLYITNGNVRIVISATDSTALSYDLGVADEAIEDNRAGIYHLEVYDAALLAWRILEGTYEISPEGVRTLE